MEQPLVSVIIPNYCHARYLDERIQSVLGQTYQNFELIILDDCSPDDGASREVIERYRTDPHVVHIVYNETNSGSTFRQWHKGFELAKGEYIWLAESDDSCESDLLQTLVEGATTHENVSVACCASRIMNGEGNIDPERIVGDVDKEFYEGREFIRKNMALGNSIPNASAVIFRRDVAMAIDRQYMDYVAAGDRLFWIELCELGNVFHSHRPMNHFRKHGDNVTPRCFREGITPREDYRINRYLERRHLLSTMEALGARCHYMSYILGGDIDPTQKKQVMRLWSCHGLLCYPLLSRLLRLYSRLGATIKHKQ